MQELNKTNSIRLSGHDLPPGMYLVHIQTQHQPGGCGAWVTRKGVVPE